MTMAVRAREGRARELLAAAKAAVLTFFVWLLKPGRPVLPLYAAERSTMTVLIRRGGLLALVMFAAFVYGVLFVILPTQLILPALAPLGLILLLIIWALPETSYVPARTMVRLFQIFLAVMILWPNYIALSVGGLPWISLRRLFGTMLLVLFLMSFSTSRQLREDVKQGLSGAPWAARLLFGFLLVQLLATVTNPGLDLTTGRLINALITINPMCFIAMWIMYTGKGTINWYLKWLFLCLIALMILGAAEWRQQHILWLYSIPSWLRVDESLLAVLLTPAFRGGYRVLATFTTPLAYGEFLALATPMVLYKMMNVRDLRWFVAWLLLDIALLTSCVICNARLGVVGFIIAHVFTLGLWGVRRWRSDKAGLIGVSTTVLFPAFAGLLLFVLLFVPAVHNRVLGGAEADSSNIARREQYQLTVVAVSRHPLFGYGPGQGAAAIGWRSPSGFLSIDSSFLSTAGDYGLVGFACYYGLILVMIAYLIRSGMTVKEPAFPFQLALAGALLVLLSTRSVLSQADNESYVFILLGISFALLSRAKRGLPNM